MNSEKPQSSWCQVAAGGNSGGRQTTLVAEERKHFIGWCSPLETITTLIILRSVNNTTRFCLP